MQRSKPIVLRSPLEGEQTNAVSRGGLFADSHMTPHASSFAIACSHPLPPKGRAKGLCLLLIATALSTGLAGCNSTLDKLESIGNAPPMSAVENPNAKANYQPLTWPLPEAPAPSRQHANSLWQPGARAFFRDQRASRVGDILRVNIEIDDKAELDNSTERSRQSDEAVGAPSLWGLEGKLDDLLPGSVDPANLLSVNNASSATGDGAMRREEKIETQVAALVTQVLPNGNMVIDGKQEIRVNYEIREISVKGVVRREDIGSDNTIDSSQVAEARIVYGGRGQITDVQQPRWGTQVIEAISPF